jgi:hypothetical protein
MAKQIYDLVATTELEAVNAMLASIGEAPLDTLDGATQSDVQTAINILRDTTREVQSEGWRFNTEFGFEIAPELAFNYADSAGVTTRLGVYRPPVNLVKFSMTQSPDQQGSRYPDAVLRPARSVIMGPAERNITRSPDFPGTRFGAEFQSTIAQGVSVPLTVTFDMEVESVTVTCYDPTFETNSMAVYDASNNLLGTVNFVSNGVPGVNVPSTKTLAFPGIKKIILTPGANDYVAYSMTYVAQGIVAINGPVFYDRARNRDGWPLSERSHLYIDAVWLFDFEYLPETCRNYIVVQASRRLAYNVLGSEELGRFKNADELRALRRLKRDQGEDDDYSMLDNADVAVVFQDRLPMQSGVADPRASAGPQHTVIT